MDGAPLGLGGSKDELGDSRAHERTHAHEARLQGDVHRRVGEAVVAELPGALPQGQDLGVGCRVAPGDGLVEGGGENAPLPDEHGTDRDLALIARLPGLGQGKAHEAFVGRVAPCVWRRGHHGTEHSEPGGRGAIEGNVRPSIMAALNERSTQPVGGRPHIGLSGGAIALFVGLAAVRVGLLLSSQNALSGDEATVGVVARHILSQGERPVFAYGADYNGGAALTAYIGAALFALFGAGETVLKTIPLAYSLAAVVVVYLFVRSAEGEAAGIWAALLYGTSVSLLKWNFDARGGYAECQLLVPVTLWVLWARVLSGGPFEAALVGLLCGFGTYVLQMFAPVGVTSFAYIGLGDRRLRKW